MFVRPTGKGIILVVVLSVLHPLATLALVLRLYARRLIRGIGVDDYLMVLGWAVALGYAICTYISIAFGGGTHDIKGPAHAYAQKMKVKWNLIALFIYTMATAFIKSSICATLLRITPSQIYRWILWSLIAVSWISSIIALAVFCTICQPVAAVWETTIGRCEPSDYNKFALTMRVFGISSIVTDWSCALIPVPILWGVKMARSTKIYTVGMLALGVFASIGTIVRMFALSNRVASDHIYSIIPVALWSDIECCLGIIGGSLATMRPLLRSAKHRSNGHSSSGLPSSSYHMRSVRKDRSSTGPDADDSYEVIVEIQGGRKDEEDAAASDSGSQRRIISPKMRIYKESEIAVKVERQEAKNMGV